MTERAEIPGKIRLVLDGSGARRTRFERAAQIIRAAGGYRWVGLYDVTPEEIAIVAWSGSGEPAHPRFPASQGLCGEAVRSGESVVVGDVTKDPRYLTTFGTTRSEIVVPIRDPRTLKVVGTIDVESETANAFGEEDRLFLERCAEEIGRSARREG